MGIRLSAYALSDGTLQRIAARPDRLDDVLGQVVVRPPDRPAASPLIARLAGWVARRQPDLREGANLDIDKAWHGLHFLLTGTAWDGAAPLNFLLGGGTLVAEDENGGVVRRHAAREVQVIDAALRGLGPAQLRERFVPEQLVRLDIYPYLRPAQATALPGEDDLRYCLHHFDRLKSFVARAAGAGLGLLTWRG